MTHSANFSTMRGEIREAIIANRPRLVQELDLDYGFLAKLVATGIITMEHKLHIDSCRKSCERVDKLLDILMRRPNYVFELFLEIISKQQPELAECFTPVSTGGGEAEGTEEKIGQHGTGDQQGQFTDLPSSSYHQIKTPLSPQMQCSESNENYNDVLKNGFVKRCLDFETRVDPRGFVIKRLLQEEIITTKEFQEIKDQSSAKESSEVLLTVLFNKKHEKSFIHLRCALEKEYKWMVDTIDKEANAEQEQCSRNIYDDAFQKIEDFNNKVGKIIAASCVIDSIGKHDDVNDKTKVTIEISHECSTEEFENHKKTLYEVFDNNKFEITCVHLSESPQCVFTTHEICPGGKVTVNNCSRTLGLYLTDKKKECYALTAGHFLRRSEDMHIQTPTPHLMDPGYIDDISTFVGKVEYVAFQAGKDRPYYDAALVRLFGNRLFQNKIVSDSNVCVHLSHELIDVEPLLHKEIKVSLFRNGVKTTHAVFLRRGYLIISCNKQEYHCRDLVLIETKGWQRAIHEPGESGVIVTMDTDCGNIVKPLLMLTGLKDKNISFGVEIRKTIEYLSAIAYDSLRIPLICSGTCN